MAPPKHALSNILGHAPLSAAAHLPGVRLHIDNPDERVEEFHGTDGVVDIFVFDAEEASVNIAQLRNFDAGEDLFLFQNMDGRELVVGTMGEWDDGSPIGTAFVLFHSNGNAASIAVLDLQYQQNIQSMILPFQGQVVFDDPFT